MLKTNPEHKIANLKKVKLFCKTITSLAMAGVSALTIYTEVLKIDPDEYIYGGDKFLYYFSDDYNLRQLATGEATQGYNKEFLESYKRYLEDYPKYEEEVEEESVKPMFNDTTSDDTLIDAEGDITYYIYKGFKENNWKLEYDENKRYTLGEVKNLRELELNITKKADLSWLNYCDNLYKLSLEISEDALDSLKAIKSLPNLSTFAVEVKWGDYYGIPFDQNYFGFLSSCENLSSLYVDSSYYIINNNFISDLAVKSGYMNLILHSFTSESFGNDFSKLKGVNKISFFGDKCCGVYDIVAAMDKKTFESLVASGVEFEFYTNRSGAFRVYTDGKSKWLKHDEIVAKAREIYQKIDEIVASLDITDKDTELDKFNKVMLYVLNDLQYCSVIADKLEEEDKEASKEPGTIKVYTSGRYSSELNDLVGNLCYAEGYLYGAFESGGEAVCGTYTALLCVLLREIGINSGLMSGNNHSWPLVELDGKYYYTDPTSIDAGIDVVDLDAVMSHPAYLMDPSFVFSLYFPDNMLREVKAKRNVDNIDMTLQIDQHLKQYKVKFRNRVFIISGLALTALLSALGIILSEKKIKELKKARRANQEISIFDNIDDIPRRKN